MEGRLDFLRKNREGRREPKGREEWKLKGGENQEWHNGFIIRRKTVARCKRWEVRVGRQHASGSPG